MKKVEYNLFSINSKERVDMIKGTDVLCLIASQGNTGVMISKDRIIMVSQSFKSCRVVLGEFVHCLGDGLALNMHRIDYFDKLTDTIIFDNGSTTHLKPMQKKNYYKCLDDMALQYELKH